MVKIVSIKCPECGASLSIEDNRDKCFCQYCGTQIMIDDGSTKHIYRRIDEARIKEAEMKEHIRLKELELEEKKRWLKIKASIILAIAGTLLILTGFLGGEATGNSDSGLYMLVFVGMYAFLAIVFIWMHNEKK